MCEDCRAADRVLLGRSNQGLWYVLDVRRTRSSPLEVERLVGATAERDAAWARESGRAVPAVRMEQEPGSAGIAVIDHYRQEMLAPYDFAGVHPTGPKETRARPVATRCEAGDVWVCRGRWNTEFLDELAAFPMSAHDDQVNALSGAKDLHVLPWTCEATLRVLANYLSDGRLPWPIAILPDPVVHVLKRSRQEQNFQFEHVVINELKAADLDAFGPIKPHKASRHGLKALSGEIDALAIDPERSRVWVVEAKDPQLSFSIRQIRRVTRDFHEPDGYVDRLLTKASDVRRDVHALLAKRGLGARNTWTVLPIIVTRHPEAPAFAANPRVPFTTLGGLRAIVRSSEVPGPGPH